MTINNPDDYINYRFKRAEESFDDALIMVVNNKWNSAINRLYYSCFYAVIALLLKNEIVTKSHDGTRIKFGNEFIRSGIIEKKYGKLYSKLFDLRQKGDYGDLFDFDEDTVTPLIVQVKEFLTEIKRIIES
jgi:uncharacterized protein